MTLKQLYAFLGILIPRVRNRSDEMRTSYKFLTKFFLQLPCQRICTDHFSVFQFIIIYENETRQILINATDSYEP